MADDRHQRPLADRGSPGRTHGNAVTNPGIRVCSTVVLTALPPAPRTRSILPQARSSQRGCAPAPNIVDNEHQNFCARTGCRAACSPPTATSSIIAATPGTASSTSLGSSCPSASGTGPMHPMHEDQRGLVLPSMSTPLSGRRRCGGERIIFQSAIRSSQPKASARLLKSPATTSRGPSSGRDHAPSGAARTRFACPFRERRRGHRCEPRPSCTPRATLHNSCHSRWQSCSLQSGQVRLSRAQLRIAGAASSFSIRIGSCRMRTPVA